VLRSVAACIFCWYGLASTLADAATVQVEHGSRHRAGLKSSLKAGLKSRAGVALRLKAAARATAGAGSKGVNPLSPNSDIHFLMQLLEKFHRFAVDGNAEADQRHVEEKVETSEAVAKANSTDVGLALQQTETLDDQSLVETKKVLGGINDFTHNMELALGAAYEATKGCAKIVCGPHASCTETTLGGQCICDEGFAGNGRDCHAPESFIPRKLLIEGGAGMKTEVADLHIAIFMGTKVVCAWRDITNANIGRVIIGKVPSGDVVWTTPERFTASSTSKAFAPQVIGLPSNRIAIAYRDAAKGGACWIRGAEIGISGLRGADSHLFWGEPFSFCQSQSHQMAAVGLGASRVAVFFADRVPATAKTPEIAFGNALLATIDANGATSVLGKKRFIDSPVVRIETTLLTPSSFVIACRTSKAVDEQDTELITRQEALAIYGEIDDSDLVFNPNSLSLEPEESQIWARGVGLVAPYTFGYAYMLGRERKLKLDVVHVDPESHRMKIDAGPKEVSKGVSPYASMLSYAYAPTDPHTFLYYESKGHSMINICKWRDDRLHKARHKALVGLQECEDFTWMRQPVHSVAAVALPGGRALFAFTTADKVPYYQIIGVSKK